MARDFAPGQLPAGARGCLGQPRTTRGCWQQREQRDKRLGAGGTPSRGGAISDRDGCGASRSPQRGVGGQHLDPAAREVDYITGQANVTAPASCDGSANPGVEGALYLDGTSLVYPSPGPNINMVDTWEASSTYDVRDVFPPWADTTQSISSRFPTCLFCTGLPWRRPTR